MTIMDKRDSIVFYCKDCDRMFFATDKMCLNEDPDACEDIKCYLLLGHRLEVVDTATVHREFGVGDFCATCYSINRLDQKGKL